MNNQAIVLFSGGQDSTTCLAWALERFDHVETLGFDYRQRHAVELEQRGIVIAAMRAQSPAWSAKLGEDHLLDGLVSPIPLCADESCQDRADLERCIGRYQAVNVKLDKAGGLTEALALCKDAGAAGMKLMVGCMLSTSLGVAPAFLAAQGAQWTDLDGPLLLARDRPDGFRYEGGRMFNAHGTLWG